MGQAPPTLLEIRPGRPSVGAEVEPRLLPAAPSPRPLSSTPWRGQHAPGGPTSPGRMGCPALAPPLSPVPRTSWAAATLLVSDLQLVNPDLGMKNVTLIPAQRA